MLKMRNISKTFNPGTINEKKIFSGLNLDINDGDFITVIGGNGAGKSTLLNLIAGVHKPDAGRIVLNGEDLTYQTEVQRAKHIGRVFQDPMMGTAPTMMVEENLAMAYRRTKKRGLKWGISNTEREFYKTELAKLKLGLEERMKTKVGTLSGGQRQALTLLMATLQKPELLLLDEHTAALDPGTSAKVLGLTQEVIAENKITTLMVTHNMQNAIDYGNRLIMMDSGKIVLDISGEEKKSLTITDLLQRFEVASGEAFTNDAAILG